MVSIPIKYPTTDIGNSPVNHTTAKMLDKNLLERIIDSGPGAAIIVDAKDYSIVLTNQYFRDQFGYVPILLEKIQFTSILSDDEQDSFEYQVSISESNTEARGKYAIFHIKNAQGVFRPYYSYISPVKDESGSISHYYIWLVKEMSKWELPFLSFDSREIFLEQFNKIGFGTFEWGLNNSSVVWSAGVYKIYELEKSQYDHLDRAIVSSFTHPDDKVKAKQVVIDLIDGKTQEVDFEFKIVTAKNNIRILTTTARLVKNADGKPIKIVGSVKDVTDERLAEQSLHKNLEDLNLSNKELEEFAYVASHDMQEPLRKITTFCDRLSERYHDKLAGEGVMYIDRITASAENMRILINNLLEFSRIAKYDQAFMQVNLNFVLREVTHELELLIEETGTKINVSHLPELEASLTQMKQLFTNIINNAIKFRKPDTKPEIRIASEIATDTEVLQHYLNPKRTYHKITISDYGLGFEEEYAQKIFQIFQRLHGKSEYPGSGIGLAICKKIVERHSGAIFAEGNPGIGASFVFYLPEKQ
jgi:signal transduction histidine kinase